MLNMLAQLITSFIATGVFGVIFNAPKHTLFKCGLIGMGGWMIYLLLADNNHNTVLATVAAAAFVGIISHVFAKVYKSPVIIFSVAGIIPLVPGGLAYDSMRNIVENDYNMGVSLAAQAFLLSGSIAFGLVFSEVLNQIIQKISGQKVKM